MGKHKLSMTCTVSIAVVCRTIELTDFRIAQIGMFVSTSRARPERYLGTEVVSAYLGESQDELALIC